jgi:hypothetical protein
LEAPDRPDSPDRNATEKSFDRKIFAVSGFVKDLAVQETYETLAMGLAAGKIEGGQVYLTKQWR